MSEPFRIKYGDIWSLVKLYKNNLGSLIDNAEQCKNSVQTLIDDLGLVAGTGSALFGTSDTIEGTADIYYGSIGDATTVAPNPLLYSPLFNGDRKLYNDTPYVLE